MVVVTTEPYLVTQPIYGNTGAIVSSSWYTILDANEWYGMQWTAAAVFNRVSYRVRNTSTTETSTYRFQLHSGAAADSPMVHEQVLTVPANTGTNGLDMVVDLPEPAPSGVYHFRVYPLSGSNATTSLGRNATFSAGNAVYSEKANGKYAASTQDLVFSYTQVFQVGAYTGNDVVSGTRTMPSYPNYSGMEFTTTQNVDALHLMLSTTQNTALAFRVVIHRGFGKDAPVWYDSGTVSVKVPVNIAHWVPVNFPEIMPAGDYQFRLSGPSVFHYRGSSSAGADISKTIEGTATTQTRGYFEIGHRLMISDAADPNAPKRWTGSEWAAGSVKRWDGAKWVGTRLTAMKPSPRRFYAVEPILAAIDNSTVAEMYSLDSAMNAAYGVTIDRSTSASTYNGHTYDGIGADPDAKENFKLFVSELAKYTPTFTTGASRIKQIVMAPNLRNGSVGLGGVAFDTTAGVTLINTVRTDTTALGRFRNNDFLLHHELHHLMNFSWTSQFNDFKDEWVALNPTAYVGDNYPDAYPTGVRPPGHIRNYGRASFLEDTADVWGSMMATSHQQFLQNLMAEDPIVLKKVLLLRKWFATKDEAFANPMYWTSIHS